MKIKFNLKQAGAIMMSSALIFASALAPASTVRAKSASGTVQLVTKSTDSAGNTTTYKYNSKGLVTKKVVKLTDKDSYSDKAYTTTTTYKYNKKNRISKKTVVNVEKVTEYETDKTTKKTIKGTKGTVTTTKKAVTKYTYSKAGLAKKAVTTQTTTKSGSTTDKSASRFSGDYRDEMINGKIIAGYNLKDYDDVENASNAYYYTGAIDQAKSENVYKTTYKDNGNGTYNKINESTSTSANYKLVYIGSDGKQYDSQYDDNKPADVKITEVKVVITNANQNIDRQSKVESLHQKKTITTSTFKYDKKKRVKKVTTTAVTTEGSSKVMSSLSRNTYKNGSLYTYNKTDNTGDTTKTTSTKSNTVTYTYDKNGHAKKKVYSDKGVGKSQKVRTIGLPNYVSTTNNNGEKTERKVTATGAASASVETTTVANGTKTTTYVTNAYTETQNVNGTSFPYNEKASTKTKTRSVKAEPKKYTCTYKYDKNGNMASYKYSGTSVRTENLFNETYDTPIYESFDNNGSLVQATVSVTDSNKYNVKNENALKSGTKTIKKSIRMTSGRKENRATKPGYGVSRVTYTLKAKKFSGKQKTDVEAQQWAIQNGALNGFVGLGLNYDYYDYDNYDYDNYDYDDYDYDDNYYDYDDYYD